MKKKDAKICMNLHPVSMKRLFKVSISVLVLLALLASCSRDKEHAAEFYVFGTVVEVKLFGASEDQAA